MDWNRKRTNKGIPWPLVNVYFHLSLFFTFLLFHSSLSPLFPSAFFILISFHSLSTVPSSFKNLMISLSWYLLNFIWFAFLQLYSSFNFILPPTLFFHFVAIFLHCCLVVDATFDALTGDAVFNCRKKLDILPLSHESWFFFPSITSH